MVSVNLHTDLNTITLDAGNEDPNGMWDIPEKLLANLNEARALLSRATADVIDHLKQTDQPLPWAWRDDVDVAELAILSTEDIEKMQDTALGLSPVDHKEHVALTPEISDDEPFFIECSCGNFKSTVSDCNTNDDAMGLIMEFNNHLNDVGLPSVDDVVLRGLGDNSFFEEDEPVEKVVADYQAGEKTETKDPYEDKSGMPHHLEYIAGSFLDKDDSMFAVQCVCGDYGSHIYNTMDMIEHEVQGPFNKHLSAKSLPPMSLAQMVRDVEKSKAEYLQSCVEFSSDQYPDDDPEVKDADKSPTIQEVLDHWNKMGGGEEPAYGGHVLSFYAVRTTVMAVCSCGQYVKGKKLDKDKFNADTIDDLCMHAMSAWEDDHVPADAVISHATDPESFAYLKDYTGKLPVLDTGSGGWPIVRGLKDATEVIPSVTDDAPSEPVKSPWAGKVKLPFGKCNNGKHTGK